jgi:hypothetical protein
MSYVLGPSSSAELVGVAPAAFGGATVLASLNPLLTLDGGAHATKIDLRGYPANVLAAPAGALWASGETTKAAQLAGSGKSIALRITNAGGADAIRWIKWHFAGGVG